MLKKIPIVFHNGLNYDYHFIIKELVELKKKTHLGENTEKWITFTVSIEKAVTRIDKNGEEITKNMSYVLKFLEGIHKPKCKYGQDDKKCEYCRIKYKYCNCYFEYTNFKEDLREHKYLISNKNCQIKFDEKEYIQVF